MSIGGLAIIDHRNPPDLLVQPLDNRGRNMFAAAAITREERRVCECGSPRIRHEMALHEILHGLASLNKLGWHACGARPSRRPARDTANLLMQSTSMTSTTDRLRFLLESAMSGRCDRALDGAVQLAQAWQAELHAVRPVELGDATRDAPSTRALPSWREPEDRRTAVRRRLGQDIQTEGVEAKVHVESGAASAVVIEVARQEGVDLVITGLASDEPFAWIQLGGTVDRLLRDMPAPLLLVRRRVRGPSRRVAVATDSSPVSRPALEAAARWFPDIELTVVHAYQAPGTGLAGKVPGKAAAASQWKDFLAGAKLVSGTLRRLQPVID